MNMIEIKYDFEIEETEEEIVEETEEEIEYGGGFGDYFYFIERISE